MLSTADDAQDSPTTQNCPARNVTDAKAEKAWLLLQVPSHDDAVPGAGDLGLREEGHRLLRMLSGHHL